MASGVWRTPPRPAQTKTSSVPFVMPLFFAFLFFPPFFFAPFLAHLLLFLAGQRERGSGFAAGTADAGLEADQLGVEEGADREVVGDADDVVELVRVFADVVELFLPVGPLDVLVGAEADSLVVLRRGDDRGFRPGAVRPAPPDLFDNLLRRRFAVGFDVVGLDEGIEEDAVLGALARVAWGRHRRG